MPTIDQGGNSFGTNMVIGTNDAYNLNFNTFGSLKAWFDAANAHFWVVSLANQNTENNSVVKLDNAGTIITRNVANSDPALTVNQQNTGSAGNITNFQFGGNTVSKITKDGFVIGTRLGVISTGSNPQYPLHINVGALASAGILAAFSQNGGLLSIENGTNATSQFLPFIKGQAVGRTDAGLIMQAFGSNSYTSGAYHLFARNAAGTGSVTGGNTFQLSNNNTPQLTVDYQGKTTIPNLAGTGTRMVTADSAGTLSAATEVRSGSYTPTITGGATSYTPAGFRFTKIGNIVHGAGNVAVTGATIGSNSFSFDLPVGTTISNQSDVTGVVSGTNVGMPTTAGETNHVHGYFGLPNSGSVAFMAIDTNATVYLEFTYIVQ